MCSLLLLAWLLTVVNAAFGGGVWNGDEYDDADDYDHGQEEEEEEHAVELPLLTGIVISPRLVDFAQSKYPPSVTVTRTCLSLKRCPHAEPYPTPARKQ